VLIADELKSVFSSTPGPIPGSMPIADDLPANGRYEELTFAPFRIVLSEALRSKRQPKAVRASHPLLAAMENDLLKKMGRTANV